MSALPKADVRILGFLDRADVCFWPKAAIETESKWVVSNGRFGEKADVRRAIRLTLHLEGTRRYHVLRTAWGEIQ